MSQDPLIGRTLRNRYKIIELLGSGGFGYTYKAKDLDLPRQPTCVVKHFKPKNLAPNKMPVAQRLFDSEAQTLYKLGNENNQIPKLCAHFEEDSQFYLVQELIEGHDLTKEIIVGSCKSEQVVFKLLKDILEVLAFVHQNNVIHRDIKPENLRRRLKDGKIVLIDFGAVKEISAMSVNSEGETSLTVAIGTPGYMPPEQQACRPRFSSDIYAVGIICFQALTGLETKKLPRDFNTGELCCDLFSECTQINPDFKAVLDTMVRFYYSQRYLDATVALQALEPLLPIYQASTTVQTPLTNLSPPSQTLQTPNSTTAQSQTVVTSVRTPISSSPVQQSFLERILQALQ